MMLVKKDRLKAHVYMAVALIVYSVSYVLFFNLFRDGCRMWQCIVYMCSALTVPVLHFCFFRQAIDAGYTPPVLKLVIPVNAVFMAIYALLHSLMGTGMSDLFFHSFVLGENVTVPSAYITPLWKLLEFLTFTVFNGLLAIEGILLLAWAFWKIIRYDKLLDEYFSGREGDEKKNNLIVLLSMVLILVPLITLLAQPFYVIRENVTLRIACIAISAFCLFITGLYSYRIGFSARSLRLMIDEDNEKKKLSDEAERKQLIGMPISETLYAECMTRLHKAIDEDKVFLQPNLTLISFSNMLATNRTYLTKIISFNYNVSFSEYINGLRIEYAVGRILDAKKSGIPLNRFAEECGYSTQASFIRNFTKYVGMTPSKYISQQLKN